MEPSEVRDHLETLERVLTQSDHTVRVGADIFVVWGVASALMDSAMQLALNGKFAMSSAGWVLLVVLAVSIVYSVVRGRAMGSTADRMTVLQREYFNVLWLAFGLAAVAQVGAHAIFGGWAQAALWTLAASLVTLYIGLHGNRRGLLGGIVLIVSLVAANFVPHASGYVLAAGMLVGYAGFGVATLLAGE